MLQLSLGYVIQADREREVTEDLRNRQALRSPRESQSLLPATVRRPPATRRGPVRAGGAGA